MKKKITAIIIIILVALVLLTATVLVLVRPKTIKVGVVNGKPMSYTVVDGNWEGYDIDFATKVFAELGYNVEFVEVNHVNREKMLEKGEIDCYMSGTDLSDDQGFIYSDKYIESTQVLLYKKDSDIDITSFSKLEPYRIGVLEDTENMYSVKEYVNYTQILEFDTISELIKSFDEEEVDVVIVDHMYADSLVKDKGEEAEYIVGIIYDTSPHTIVLPEKKTKLQSAINEKIAEYKNMNYFDTLKEAYSMEMYYN